MRGLCTYLVLQMLSWNNRKRLGNGAGCGSVFLFTALQRGVMSVGYCLDVVIHEGALTSEAVAKKCLN